MKFLIFTTDLPPLPGLPTSGTALRTFGLGQGLRTHGHEIVVSVPKTAISGFEKRTAIAELPLATREQISELKSLAFDSFNQSTIISQVKPDVIICGHWPAMALTTKPAQPLIIDLAGPFLLESFYQGARDHNGSVLAKLSVLATADYFLVSGPSQRLYFLSFLMRAGIPNPEARIAQMVMPLSPQLPARKTPNSESERQILFGGVFLPWQDPEWALRETANYLEQKQSGRLVLVGGEHPNYPIQEGKYAALFQELEHSLRVKRHPLLPLEEFQILLSQADAALDVMDWNLERQLAVTIRTTSYLWSGVPVIYNDFADLGELIRKYDAGWCVGPGDKVGLSTALDQILTQPDLLEEKSANAQRLAREIFSWDAAVKPLLELLQNSAGSIRQETDIAVDLPEVSPYALSPGKIIQQEFLCRVPGLSRVECRMQVPEQLSGSAKQAVSTNGSQQKPCEAQIRARVYETQNSQHIVEETFVIRDMNDKDWTGLEFEPLADSAGKTYCLELEYLGEHTNTCVRPWILKSSPYPMLQLKYSGQPISHACLCMKTTCRYDTNSDSSTWLTAE